VSRTMKEADASREYRQGIKVAEERNAFAHPAVAARINDLEAEVGRLTKALQEEQVESLRQAEIARDALAEVERLRAALPAEGGDGPEHLPGCRVVTGRVNDGYCYNCKRRRNDEGLRHDWFRRPEPEVSDALPTGGGDE
jgi:hypothetical protein